MTTYGTETATTTWTYSSDRGFLTRKQYADGKGTNYTYTAAGRLATRAWARGVITTYTYDSGGLLVLTNYSDSTPDVAITYDALGRKTSESSLLSSVSQSSVSYSYNPGNLQIDTETITYDFNADNTVDFARVIDRSQDTLGRESGWQLKAGTTVENSVSYGFSTLHGRLTSVTGPNNDAHVYGYLPNSNLISTVTNTSHVVTNVWEANRNVLLSKENKVGSTVISKYEYGVNDFGQRTNVSQTGTAFTATRSIAWGYNSKGEVVKADHSDNVQSRAYQYDGIGNRLQGSAGVSPATTTSYTPNALNQYSAIGSLTPAYDDDGNATAYPLPSNLAANSNLVWDGENRLIEVQQAGTSVPLVRYAYDSQSRRITETVGSSTTAYVYDGWNPIAEYNTSYALAKTYTWGMDLSGGMQGSGGVGGLLAVSDGSGTYYATYDGNGNVSEYLDSTGSLVAHYEYDPFGKTTVLGGSKASDFSHRFSTKTQDATTGLYYYGYRFYDPETGRWPSRDPIEESGGLNLYGFVRNNGISRIDRLGQLEFNVGGGIGGGATLFLPSAGIYSVGLSVFYSVYIAVGVDTKRSTDRVQCAICHSGAVTVMYGVGAAANVALGPIVTFGPSGDLNDLSGFSIQVGAGGGFPDPKSGTLVGPSVEVTVDVDIKTGQVTVVIPKAGLGITAYAAIRVTGQCTGCTGIFGKSSIRNTKLSDCLVNLRSAITAAFAKVNNSKASGVSETRIVYTHPTPISEDSLSED